MIVWGIIVDDQPVLTRLTGTVKASLLAAQTEHERTWRGSSCALITLIILHIAPVE